MTKEEYDEAFERFTKVVGNAKVVAPPPPVSAGPADSTAESGAGGGGAGAVKQEAMAVDEA